MTSIAELEDRVRTAEALAASTKRERDHLARLLGQERAMTRQLKIVLSAVGQDMMAGKA